MPHDMLFPAFTAADLDTLCTYGTARRYPPRCILMTRGDESHGLFVVREGRVRIFIADERGNELTLRYEGPGAFFGELGVIGAGERSASAMTVTASRLVYVSQARFEECLHAHGGLAVKLIRHLAARVTDLTGELAACALMSVYERVRDRLQAMAVPRDGHWVVEERLTHRELAGLVGAGREMVTRVLTRLHRHGYVATVERRIHILRPLPRHLPAEQGPA